MDINEKGKSSVTITDRKSITLDGVLNVLGFDEGYIIVATAKGEVHIEGQDLKIENLSKEKGEILISGKIDAFYYREKAGKKKKAFR